MKLETRTIFFLFYHSISILLKIQMELKYIEKNSTDE